MSNNLIVTEPIAVAPSKVCAKREKAKPYVPDWSLKEIAFMMIGARDGEMEIISQFRQMRDAGRITPVQYFAEVLNFAVLKAEKNAPEARMSEAKWTCLLHDQISTILSRWEEPAMAEIFTVDPDLILDMTQPFINRGK